MNFDESLDLIRGEFFKEMTKRKLLIDKIAELEHENAQLNRDLKVYRSIYPMKNEVCEKCAFADECIDENRVEGKPPCTSFHAKEDEEDHNED